MAAGDDGSGEEETWGEGVVLLVAPSAESGWSTWASSTQIISKAVNNGIRMTARVGDCTHVVVKYIHLYEDSDESQEAKLHRRLIRDAKKNGKILVNFSWLQMCVRCEQYIDPGICSGFRPYRRKGGVQGFRGKKIAPCVDEQLFMAILIEMIREAGGIVSRVDCDFTLVSPNDPQCLDKAEEFTRPYGGSPKVLSFSWLEDCLREWTWKCPEEYVVLPWDAPETGIVYDRGASWEEQEEAEEDQKRKEQRGSERMDDDHDDHHHDDVRLVVPGPPRRQLPPCEMEGRRLIEEEEEGTEQEVEEEVERMGSPCSSGPVVSDGPSSSSLSESSSEGDEEDEDDESEDDDVDFGESDDDDVPLLTFAASAAGSARERDIEDEPLGSSRYVEHAHIDSEARRLSAEKKKKKRKKKRGKKKKKKKNKGDQVEEDEGGGSGSAQKKPKSKHGCQEIKQDHSEAWKRGRSRMDISDDSNSDGEGGGGAKLTTRVTVPAKSTQNWSKFLCNVEESKTGWLLKITGKDGVVHPDRLKELCEAMSNNTSSRKLDLDNAAFADDGCVHIAAMLRSNKALRKLDLQYCSITDAGCAILCDALKDSSAPLRELNLMSNNIGDASIDTLGTALALQPRCRVVITNELIERIAKVRRDNLKLARGGCSDDDDSDISVEESASHHRVVRQQQPQATGDRAGMRLDFGDGHEAVHMEVNRTARSSSSCAAVTRVEPWDDDQTGLGRIVGRAGGARDDSPAGSSPVELTPLGRGKDMRESQVGEGGSREGGEGEGGGAASPPVVLTPLDSERHITEGADDSPPRQERMECDGDACEEHLDEGGRQVSSSCEGSATREVAEQEEGGSSPKQGTGSSHAFPSHRFNLMELQDDDDDDDDDGGGGGGGDGHATGNRWISSREQGGASSGAPVVDTPSPLSPRRRSSTPVHERASTVSASNGMQPPKDGDDVLDGSGVSSTPDDVVADTGPDCQAGDEEVAHDAQQTLTPGKEVVDKNDVNSLSGDGDSVADGEGRDREMVDVLSSTAGHPVGDGGQESGLEDDGTNAASPCDEGDDVCIPETPSPIKKGDSKDSQAHTRQRPPFGGAIRGIGGSAPLSGGKQLGL